MGKTSKEVWPEHSFKAILYYFGSVSLQYRNYEQDNNTAKRVRHPVWLLYRNYILPIKFHSQENTTFWVYQLYCTVDNGLVFEMISGIRDLYIQTKNLVKMSTTKRHLSMHKYLTDDPLYQEKYQF